MTISKERFEAIVQELADETDILCDEARSFAHALIKRVEAESDPVIRHYNGDRTVSDYVELPLVGE